MRILVYETSQHRKDYFALKVAFETLGHQVDIFDWTKYLYKYENVNLINRIKDRLLFSLTVKRINTDLRNRIKENRYDLWLVVRGDHIEPETLLYAKTRIPLIINWNSDDVFNPINNTQHMLDCLGLYDCIFSPRGHLKEEYIKKGVKNFEVLHWYYRPGLLYSRELIAQKQTTNDIAFVGSWSNRREKMIEPIINHHVNIWGWGWSRKAHHSFVKRVDCKPHIDMEGMMNMFATSKININILTLENRDTTNLRNYEIPAAGGFQLSERSDEILEIFEEGQEIACFGGAEELISKCDYYLRNETERKRIASNGYDRLIKGNYSIVERARQIMGKISVL